MRAYLVGRNLQMGPCALLAIWATLGLVLLAACGRLEREHSPDDERDLNVGGQGGSAGRETPESPLPVPTVDPPMPPPSPKALRFRVDTTPTPTASVHYWPYQLETGPEELALQLIGAGTYDFVVDWGDGKASVIDGPDDPDRIHRYPAPGQYTISLEGVIEGWGRRTRVELDGCTLACEASEDPLDCLYVDECEGHEYFSDAAKFLQVLQWGSFRFSDTPGQFEGHTSLNVVAEDVPDLTGTTTLASAFHQTDLSEAANLGAWDVSGITDLSNAFASSNMNGDLSAWDTSNATTMRGMFGYSAFNGDISGWDTSNVEDMRGMFSNSSFNQDIGAWNLAGDPTMGEMFDGAGLSTENYDKVLIGWAAQQRPSIHFDAGSSKYSAAAAAARDQLINELGWTIVDGGPAE